MTAHMRLLLTFVLFLIVAAAGFLVLKPELFGEPSVETIETEVAPTPEDTDGSPHEPVFVQDTTPAPQPNSSAGLTKEIADKNKRAVDLLANGKLDAAIALFEQCVDAAPDESVIGRNLAEALARLAQRQHESNDPELRVASLETLARAVELDSSRPSLATLYDRWRKSSEAEKDFWHKQTDHFELSFDGTRDELMSGTAPLENELEASYLEFGELFGFFPVEDGRPRLHVVLYRKAGFDAVTGLGDWAGGVFDGTVRVPVEDLGRETENLKKVLRHELVHSFVQQSGGSRVPGWLNEGLAQYLEAPFSSGRTQDIERSKRKLHGQTLFNLEKLGGSLATWDDTEAIKLAYAQSLVFVDYLDRMYGQQILFDMVAGCKGGVMPVATFKTRIGIDLAVVLEDFAAAF